MMTDLRDTHSFKRLGQEMLGLAGYEKGYMVYISALSKNDLEALRTITGNSGYYMERIQAEPLPGGRGEAGADPVF